MALNIGTYDISFLLAARNQTSKQVGEANVIAVLQADLAAHNALITEMVGDICEVSTDATRAAGMSSDNSMTEVDEFGLAPTQKVPPGYNISTPLKLFQFAAGWDRKFLETASVADLAQKQLDAETAHRKTVEAQIAQAVLRKSNFTVRDYLVDNVSLSCFRFCNADGHAPSNGPNGETFAGTHQHYICTGTAAAQDWINAVETVIEHGHGSGVVMYISRTDEAVVTALTGFDALVPVYLTSILAAGGVPVARLDETRLDNRQIGFFHGAAVWTKPWMPASYAFVFAAGDARKPLVFRQRASGAFQGLRLAAEFDSHPLQAQVWEAEFGVSQWTRTNGSLLYTASATWADGA